MKTPILGLLTMTAAASFCLAQIPGEPAANGLTPTTTTYFINSFGNTNASGVYTNGPSVPLNNDFKNIESIGIAIAANGNVVVGWENDGNDLTDYEGVWTLFDSSGKLITLPTVQNSLDPVMSALGTITNKWLSFFRADGTAVWPGTSWGPKVQANAFGDGFGMGAISYALSVEIPALAAWDDGNLGDTPNVQLLNNNGTPAAGVLPGVSAAYTAASGDIRIGDWEYLANGNIMIVGESRQNADLVDLYGGAAAANHCVFRILTPSGTVVKSETLVSEFPTQSNMSNGAGVTSNGFALRFTTPDGVAVRLFDNNGNPTSGNLILATITGHPEAGNGGNGSGAGFHGNSKDAYVAVCSYATTNFWLTVLNANGTVRYSRIVADDLDLSSAQDCDAAINSDGQVVVAMSAQYSVDNLANTVLGRRFTAAGIPVKKTFFLGEFDRPAPDPINGSAATSPRIAWRGDLVAAAWESGNDPAADAALGLPKTLARRLFSTQSPSITLTRSGNNVTLSWPVSGTAYTLESASAVTGAIWTPVPGVVNNSVTVSSAAGNQFFRLRL